MFTSDAGTGEWPPDTNDFTNHIVRAYLSGARSQYGRPDGHMHGRTYVSQVCRTLEQSVQLSWFIILSLMFVVVGVAHEQNTADFTN